VIKEERRLNEKLMEAKMRIDEMGQSIEQKRRYRKQYEQSEEERQLGVLDEIKNKRILFSRYED